MIHILESKTPTKHVYVYISTDYVSSDFDSLEQMSDVNFDDPSKSDIQHFGNTQSRALASFLEFDDITLLATVDSLDNLLDNYPELFL